jgi:hypothetical protein
MIFSLLNTNFLFFVFYHGLVLFLFHYCNKILLYFCFVHVMFLFMFFLFDDLNL